MPFPQIRKLIVLLNTLPLPLVNGIGKSPRIRGIRSPSCRLDPAPAPSMGCGKAAAEAVRRTVRSVDEGRLRAWMTLQDSDRAPRSTAIRPEITLQAPAADGTPLRLVLRVPQTPSQRGPPAIPQSWSVRAARGIWSAGTPRPWTGTRARPSLPSAMQAYFRLRPCPPSACSGSPASSRSTKPGDACLTRSGRHHGASSRPSRPRAGCAPAR